ncbi:GNAT family N-acetyltransferase [Bacillus sp. Cr_A10]|uniref:GNAT family N-acetyltransferase n=1 Tax=Bacillus sp. Cr_A10 TaxID=3033993 RepID=UPI0023DB580D|nr:GNAT family N-acetyltransferase [Bacillus sp. Cr_A10]MDF2065171.1 GNAT family N-acetyltransferase [Bacillus sp. Cr_A10]
MDILIELLKEKDAEDLLKFELENRAFFEEMVPSRGDDYYNPQIFKERHKDLLEEQEQGVSYFYLIKNLEGSILGRINLVDIDKSLKEAYLGYRVGRVNTGKGIANKALKLLIDSLKEKNIKTIIAKTTTNNIASQRVLEKNGFLEFVNEEHEKQDDKLKFLYYSWTINKERSY